MLRRINQVLPELLFGILVYGILIQLAGIWFVKDSLHYTTGLWIGIVVAIGMAINMAIVILDTVDALSEKRSSRKASLYAVMRYIAVVSVFVIAWYFELGNLLSMFVGVMGLKVSAYLQPFTHKFFVTIQEKSIFSHKVKKR